MLCLVSLSFAGMSVSSLCFIANFREPGRLQTVARRRKIYKQISAHGARKNQETGTEKAILSQNNTTELRRDNILQFLIYRGV